MSKDVEPITEKLTIYEKLKRYFKQKIYKHKVETVTIDLQNNTLRSIKAVNDFGVSAEEASKALEKVGKAFGQVVTFEKILSPNEMRKIVDDDITTLYADGNPYCIINQKGDVIWQSKN